PSDAAWPDGEPPAATARSTDRVGPRPVVLLVGGAVLVLALVVVLVLALASVFGRSGPEDAVESYVAAAKESNTAAMTDQLCDQYRRLILQTGGEVFTQEGSGALVRTKILSVTEAERTAEVTVES